MLLTPEIVVACIIQNNKACENLLLYIFKHEISRKKIKEKKKIIIQKSFQMFVVL